MSDRKTSLAKRLRYRLFPDHAVGEILAKPWIDTVIPVAILVVLLVVFAFVSPEFFIQGNLSNLTRFLGENVLLAIGQAIVIIAGGIDLSVGSIFALCNFVALGLIFTFKIPVALVFPLVVLTGALAGSLNGILIGYLRLRAFLATLVTLIIIRAIVELLVLNYSAQLMGDYEANGWGVLDFAADGFVFFLPSSFAFALIIAVCAHIFLTRMRIGWHMLAVGGARRSAFNVGIPVGFTVFLTYVISGALAGAAAFFYAARLNAAGNQAGLGLELIVITGVVLGGVSLGGGRGSVIKAIIGTVIVVSMMNGMLRLGLASGGSTAILGVILLLAVVFDIRWSKNRLKVLNRAYVSPTLVEMDKIPSIDPSTNSLFSQNDALKSARPIGLGIIDGPEDMVIDDEGNLFAGTRNGDIYRFKGPNYTQHELYVHIGGRPLGCQVDRDGSLVFCVAGMGLYRVTKKREVIALSIQTNRSLMSINDDSRVRMADDLDIAPDGRIFYTDPTTRYEISAWLTDALEGRGNGRLLCYDPKDGSTRTVLQGLVFANGVCLTYDGESVLVAETWAARIKRYWISGAKAGKSELFMDNLPGYPDNINRSSDGNYWVALVGTRSPTFDLALRLPSFRKRMIRRVAPDNWLMPNSNQGCVIKFDGAGHALKTLWDSNEGNHPQVTSVREHMGKLYLGGVFNNRIGELDMPEANEKWTGYESYWGGES